MKENIQKKKIIKNLKIKIISIVFVLLLIVGGLIFVFLESITKEEFIPSENIGFSSQKEYLEYYEGLKKEYQKDTYGGSTPKETLQLFINALKAGNTELAAKYFIVEKQQQMAEQFKVGKENNELQVKINQLEKSVLIKSNSSLNSDDYMVYILEYIVEKTKPLMDEDGNVIFTIPAGEKISNTVIFLKNNKVWKIESL